jgi:hypothetical protein
MRKTLIALAVLPLVALAQGPNKNPPQAAQAGQPGPWDPVKVEKRMRLARTLGLAQVLDLDTAQALKLDETLGKFDDRRRAIRKQVADATEALRNAARGAATPKPTAAEVDGAIAKLLDARTQLQAIDRDMLQAITKDLSPEQKARAALFLGRFRDRIERHMWMMRPGMGGPGMGRGMGPGMMERGQQGMRTRWEEDDHLARHGGPDDPPPFADEDD